MGTIQNWGYVLDASFGTVAQALNVGGRVAMNGFDNPIQIIGEGFQMTNNAFQLYQGLTSNGGVDGIANNPDLYK